MLINRETDKCSDISAHQVPFSSDHTIYYPISRNHLLRLNLVLKVEASKGVFQNHWLIPYLCAKRLELQRYEAAFK